MDRTARDERSTSRRDLVLLEAANVLGGISNAVVMIVLPWLILERTGSAAAAGLVGALSSLPGIIVSPVVGVSSTGSAARRSR